MLLCALGPLPCKTGKTWAGIILLRGSFPSAHAKTSYALQPHCPALFCPFSPEAVLLTILGDERSTLEPHNNYVIASAARQSRTVQVRLLLFVIASCFAGYEITL